MKIRSLHFSINQFWGLFICVMLMAVVSIVHSHKLLGYDLGKSGEGKEQPTMQLNEEDQLVINTTNIGKDIIGFAGPTPVEIYVEDGKIIKIKGLENRETPEFYAAVRNSDLMETLDGKSLAEAANIKIDAVSGATYTSNAIIGNIHAGIEYALKSDNIPVKTETQESSGLNLKFYVTLLIILTGAIVPLFFRNRKYRVIQLILNVVVLGFWSGTFISYSMMVSTMTNGIWRMILIPGALMLSVAILFPLFGKPNHYCNWICPYGSLQELVNKCTPKNIKISPRMNKRLTIFRNLLWFVLMWLLWTGLCFDWMGYEPFAAFFFNEASWVVLGIAGGFLVLSLFITRPFCRFVCATGTLLKFMQ